MCFCIIFQRVQDYQNFYLNLTEANTKGILDWKLEYSAKVFYQLSHIDIILNAR